MAFVKAERKRAKLRLAIMGPSGSGKTFSALSIASGLGGKIALIDTEQRSGELYSDKFDYDIAPIDPPYTPAKYIELIKEAGKAGYDVVIVDSLSHAWAGEGGLLDIHDKATRASSTKNSFTAWRDVTPQHNRLVDAILQSPSHVIVTLRTKTAYEIQEQNGKKVPVKVGMDPVFRSGIEYEFTVCLDMSLDGHVATASKDRTSLFDGQYFVPAQATGETLLGWLNSGIDAPPTPEAEPGPSEAFLATMEDMRKKLGDDVFFGTLGEVGFETVQEVKPRKKQTELYGALKSKLEASQQAANA